MRKLRIAVFFLLAALSCARAQCVDFKVFINEDPPSCEKVINYTITFGDSLIFKISSTDGEIRWKAKDGITIDTTSSYTPILLDEEDAIFTYIIELDGVVKTTIILDFKARRRTVSFNSGGSDVKPQDVIYNQRATKPSPDPTREGYDFDGWDFDFNTLITQDTTINAKEWKPKKYTITLNPQGGAVSPNSLSVEYGGEIPALPTPTGNDGYTFKGWFTAASGGEVFNAAYYTFAENKTLYAQWTPNEYTIYFDPDGGTSLVLSKSVTFRSAVGDLPTPTKTGYDFKGWYSGNTRYIASTIYSIPDSITLKASWEIQKFTVSFITNGSTVPSQVVEYYGNATEPSLKPTREGYDFDGWDFNFNTPITQNTPVNAKWKPKIYTVSFNVSTVPPQTVEYNQKATEPSPDPTRTGYDFNGWDFNFNTPITQNITINAKWKPKTYTITLNPQGGRFSRPADAYKSATYNEAIGALPAPIKDAYEFKGWFTEETGGVKIDSSRVYSYTTDTVLYAHWEFVKGSPPTASMLQTTPPLPFSLTYSGRQAEPVEITKREDVYGEFGKITTLYNGKPERPRDAGTYKISANIEASEDYAAALVENIGSFTISKRSVALSIKQALVKDKEYDTQTKAEVTSLVFETGNCEANTGLCGSDIVSPNDYELNANFEQQDAGENIPVKIAVYWLQKELYKNYILSTSLYSTTANIKPAKTILKINVPEIYELSNTQDLQDIIEVTTNPFINKNRDIAWKYKWEKAAEYSDTHPNRVGNWTVRAYIESTNNYTGAEDIGAFLVTRGSATTVVHGIGFDEETPFKEDAALSTPQKKYYVKDYEPSGCKINSVKIKVEVKEADIVLKVGKIPKIPVPLLEKNIGIFTHTFEKQEPGLDTIAYSFYSLDGIYEEDNFILIERPIHFDSVTVQKWNNLFLVNNNTQKNGGYNFTGYQWFKNGEPLPKDTLQFYSAGPYRTDTLDTEDKYSIQMNYAKGDEQFRISTCEGNSKRSKANPAASNSAFKKQTLGINGKSAKLGAKVYNSKGERSNGTAPGVYLIEE
jgi:uncharacterized repeat protein (TIGR02543 family)